MNINAAYYSSKGRRARNEDSISLLENSNNVIAIVADGLGGEGGGDDASLTAVKAVSGRLSGGNPTANEITRAIAKANEEIIKSHNDKIKMKSTVAVLSMSRERSFAANIGDTRIYQIRDNRIIFQSIDHSVSQMSVNVGEINAEEIRNHIDRNRLTKALGAQESVEADLSELSLRNGDAFLLCSDGFWEYVFENEMCVDLSESANADVWLSKMRNRVESRIKPTGDNHSAIAIIVRSKGNY